MIIFTLISLLVIAVAWCLIVFVGVFWFVVADVAVFFLLAYGLYKIIKR